MFRGGKGGKGMDMNSMLKQAQKIQDNMMKLKDELLEKEYESSSGGGAVKVKINGRHELVSIDLDSSVVDADDIEMLQDLIVAAVNEAVRAATDDSAEEMGKLTGGINMPF